MVFRSVSESGSSRRARDREAVSNAWAKPTSRSSGGERRRLDGDGVSITAPAKPQFIVTKTDRLPATGSRRERFLISQRVNYGSGSALRLPRPWVDM